MPFPKLWTPKSRQPEPKPAPKPEPMIAIYKAWAQTMGVDTDLVSNPAEHQKLYHQWVIHPVINKMLYPAGLH